MGFYKEIDGDLVALTKSGAFDVSTHGCNCFCSMGSGIAPQMAKAFSCDKYALEDQKYKGDPNKLGQIGFGVHITKSNHPLFKVGDNIFDSNLFEEFMKRWRLTSMNGIEFTFIVNTYSQYYYGRYKAGGVDTPLDYDALRLSLRKINMIFKGLHIGLPKIGCGLAGGDWDIVKPMIIEELSDMDVTYVNFVG